MLDLTTVKEVRRLLDEGQLSQRKISLKLKVSRGIVGAIASGRRELYGKSPEQLDTIAEQPNLPPERCLGCGALVYKPCVLCEARAFRVRQRQQNRLRPCDHQRVA